MISRLLKAPMPLLRQIVLDRDGKVRPAAQCIVRLLAWLWLAIGVFLFVASWIGMGRPIYGLGYWLVYFSVSALLIALTYPASQRQLSDMRDGLKAASGTRGVGFRLVASLVPFCVTVVMSIVKVIDLLIGSFVGELSAPAQSQTQTDEGGWNNRHIQDVELGNEYYDPFKDNRWRQK